MKKIFSLLFVITIVSFCTIINVKATITWDSNTSSVTITRTVTNVSAPVTNTFTYTVTADANNPTGATGAPTSGSIAMSAQAVSGTTATKTGTISFSGMSFTQPGHYKYTITETASTNASRYPIDSTNTYTVEIVVHNTNTTAPNGTDYTAYILVWDNAATPAKAPANFTSAAPQNQFTYVTLTKNVTGELAKPGQYFKYSIQVYTVGTYTISGLTALTAAESCTGSAQSATTTVTGKTSSPTAKNICLKQGDTVTIGYNSSLMQIPINSKITITETVPTGYNASYKIDSGSSTSGGTITQHTLSTTGNHTVEFTNDYPESPTMGVLITTLPYIILIAIGAIGAFLFMSFKKKKLATEDEVL